MAASAVPFLGLTAWLIYSDLRVLTRHEQSEVQRVAELTAGDAAEFLAAARRTLALIAAQHRSEPLGCSPLVRLLAASEPHIRELGVVELTGAMSCSASDTPAAGMHPSARDAITRGAFHISRPYRVSGTWRLSLVEPLRAGEGNVIGAVRMEIDLARAPLLLQDPAAPPGTATRIVHGGTVIASSVSPHEWIGRDVSGLPIMRAAFEDGGPWRGAGLDGEDRVAAFARLPGVGWSVVSSVSASSIYRESRRRALASSTIALAALLAVGLLAFAIGRGIAGPMRRIAAGAERIAAGGRAERMEAEGPAEMVQVTDRLNAMLDALRENERQLVGMTRRLVALQENERRTLARELHDRIGQNLAVLAVNLQRLRAANPAGSVEHGRIEDSIAMLEATAESVSDLLTELKPPMLASYGLLDALEWNGREFVRRTGIELTVEGDEPAPRPSPEVEMALFRIAQSALANVAKHSGATSARIDLKADGRRLRMSVVDDGRGFDPAAPEASKRWGLASMKERAEAIEAALRIESSPGRGTSVTVELGLPS